MGPRATPETRGAPPHSRAVCSWPGPAPADALGTPCAHAHLKRYLALEAGRRTPPAAQPQHRDNIMNLALDAADRVGEHTRLLPVRLIAERRCWHYEPREVAWGLGGASPACLQGASREERPRVLQEAQGVRELGGSSDAHAACPLCSAADKHSRRAHTAPQRLSKRKLLPRTGCSAASTGRPGRDGCQACRAANSTRRRWPTARRAGSPSLWRLSL